MPIPLSEIIAERMRGARQALGLTQAEAAERCGLAPEAYGRLERGLALPRADTLVALAQALEVSSDHLLGLDRTQALVARDTPVDAELSRLTAAHQRLSPAARRALLAFLRSLPVEKPRPSRRRAGR